MKPRAHNPTRDYLDAFAGEAAASVTEGSKVLDAGAGLSRYRKHFGHCGYESADFAERPGALAPLTYICDLVALPVEDERFDLALCTQVLEHLPEPLAVLRELWRVLRPGARLWLSAPLYYQEHLAPYDFYRYTQYGLRHLLGRAGFGVERLEWMGGYYGTLSYQLSLAGQSLPTRSKHYGGGFHGALAAGAAVPLRAGFRALSRVYAGLDLRHAYTAHGHPKNYQVVARKQEPSEPVEAAAANHP